MDLVGDGAATSTGDNKRRVHEKNRDWHKRLHLRKAAAQPPAMQSRDKRGPKTTADERERGGSQKPPLGAAFGMAGGGNALRFTCSQCQDGSEYVPKDLARHFEEKHRGSPPVFPCHLCPFTTHEFSYLQVHLLSHEDNFSSCSMCGDSVPRTWPEFAAHLTTYHCSNGKYLCKICQNFSTGDVRVFLEHICLHDLNTDRADDGLLRHLKEKKTFGPETPAQAFRCQQCGYEASQKWLITKHVKAVHACQNGNQTTTKKKKNLSVRSIAAISNDIVPKMKPRLTRSAVREMCWLTQDCLSLPGREFLDKYCHLSDPKTTLEETQQFLMKSVAGETGDQKWTKALKTVLSNVPQDVALYAKSENGASPNSSDLTVLTVKNKITVGQNGATYAKRLKMVASSDREAASPGSAAGEVLLNGDQSSLSDHVPRAQVETRPHVDVAVSGPAEPRGGVLMQENRENQEVKTEQKNEDHSRKLEGPVPNEGIHSGCDAKLTQESAEMSCVHKALPKIKRPNRRRRRKTRFKRVDKRSAGLPLKIVLKKNPAEKQWVSQSSLSPSGGDAADGPDKVRIPPTEEQTVCSVQPAEVQQKKWTKGCRPDLPSEAISSTPQSKPGEESVGSKNMSPNWPEGSMPPSLRQDMRADTKKSAGSSENDADKSGPSGQTSRPHPRATADDETHAEVGGLQTARCGVGSQVTEEGEEGEGSAADGATPRSSSSESSPVSQPVITPQDEVSVEGSSLVLPAEQGERTAQRIQNGDAPAASCHSPVTANRQEPSPAASACRRSHPAPKTLERTLKLVATNPSQLVKRPAGDQPVVVLNHPDAEIPEVARIMEVVNRYRGEVNKVILSRRTLKALSALSGETPETDDLLEPERRTRDSVQERFMLKFKFRRLSKKKYEIVDAVSLSGENGDGAPAAASKFRCWFCGRVFTSRETWMSHRQRHLMEWKL